MKTGDLVRIVEGGISPSEDPGPGTVLKFDVYGSTNRFDARYHGTDEPIVEVLWSRGDISWILQERLEVVNESR